MAALPTLPHAALVVGERWPSMSKLDRVRPSVVTEGLAEAQVRFPTVPIMFYATRPPAQERAYRFLGAAIAHHSKHGDADRQQASLPLARPAPPAEPTPTEIRAWATSTGLPVTAKGRIMPEVVDAYHAAHQPLHDSVPVTAT